MKQMHPAFTEGSSLEIDLARAGTYQLRWKGTGRLSIEITVVLSDANDPVRELEFFHDDDAALMEKP